MIWIYIFLLGYRPSIQPSSFYSSSELVYGMKAKLGIELDLPPQKMKMIILWKSSYLTWCETKRMMFIKIFSKHRPPRKGSVLENMAVGRQSLELEMKYGICKFQA